MMIGENVLWVIASSRLDNCVIDLFSLPVFLKYLRRASTFLRLPSNRSKTNSPLNRTNVSPPFDPVPLVRELLTVPVDLHRIQFGES
jgi:hypothetical protein